MVNISKHKQHNKLGKGAMKKSIWAVLLLSLFVFSCQKKSLEDYRQMIDQGKFSEASKEIKERLKNDSSMSDSLRQNLLFELERMKRIRKDFGQTEQDVLKFIKQYVPDVTPKDLLRWEKEKKLEYMVIDGKKMFFNQAARNLFRLDKHLKKIWQQAHADENKNKFDLDAHIKQVMKDCLTTNEPYSDPIRFRIHYSVTVLPDQVPAGDTIRCWLPFPREIPHRQINIKIRKTDPPKYILAPNSYLQRTIYFEKPSAGSDSTRFSVTYEYTSQGVYVDIDPQKVQPVNTNGPLRKYLRQRPPHIVFWDTLRVLSKKIVGNETNPYRIAQKIFAWVDTNITWASAREYSTIRHIGLYPVLTRHGDCGIQTLLFITLLRMNGIPARWESGWEFQPPHDSMHDWSMVYFKPYGWVPADVTYGMRQSNDPKLKFFYLNGMDSYRLIFNDDFGRKFYPPKKFFRSETVDSQRGEVEWKGGNLYFDQWKWNMDWEIISK